VRVQTGFLPDSRRERATVAAGGRWAFGYGKLLVRGKVIHFDPELAAHAGVHITDGSTGPLLDVGLGLGAWIGRHVEVRLDLPILFEGEERSSWTFVLGFAPALGFGVLL
jgi:hypothetical protein